MPSKNQSPDELLLAITRCPNLAPAQSNPAHPCAKVAGAQAAPPGERPVPEPWSGRLESAPLLFIGSNPGGSNKREHIPRESWNAAATIDFFRRRFDRGAGHTEQADSGALYTLENHPGGQRSRARRHVNHWSVIRKHAEDILGRRPEPGRDFVLTEMVHCKSGREAGVGEAIDTCADLWLPAIMETSAAPVIILLGSHARKTAHRLWETGETCGATFGLTIGQKEQAVVKLPHTNYRGPRKVAQILGPEETRRLRLLVS